MKSKLLMSAAVLAATAYLCPLQAENLNANDGSHSHAKILQLAQEKGGGGGMGGGSPGGGPSNAAPEGKGGERAPDKGAQKGMEKGGAEKGGMEKGGAEKGKMGKDAGEKGSEKGERTRDSQRDMKKDEKSGEKSEGKSREKTTGDREKSDRNATGKDSKEKSSAQKSSGSGKNVQLNSTQQTKIKTVIKSKSVTHLRRADVKFSITIGTRIPTSVHYYPLPVEIIEVVPEYRGYDYIIVDDEVIIIEPDTREIVTIIQL